MKAEEKALGYDKMAAMTRNFLPYAYVVCCLQGPFLRLTFHLFLRGGLPLFSLLPYLIDLFLLKLFFLVLFAFLVPDWDAALGLFSGEVGGVLDCCLLFRHLYCLFNLRSGFESDVV